MSNIISIKHEVWADEEGLTTLCYAGNLGGESRSTLQGGEKLLYSFFADSHYDAMTKYYQFMKWGVYTTEFEEDKLPYNQHELKKRAKLRMEIDSILWEDWDPIGVNDMAPRDEYQSYVPQILNMVMSDKTTNAIAERLYYIETVTMGLMGNKEKCEEIAEKIVGLLFYKFLLTCVYVFNSLTQEIKTSPTYCAGGF